MVHHDMPNNVALEEPEIVARSITGPLNFAAIFGREAPLEIDLGCGNGAFLVGLARAHPDRNFFGVERLARRVQIAAAKLAELPNVRLLRAEVNIALVHLIPPVSVAAFHLLFPDPWPKRRHHRRRTFTGDFLTAVHRALERGGLLHLATDHPEYFRQMEELAKPSVMFRVSDEQIEFPATAFEAKFRAQGLPIYRLLLRKVSSVR
jgi:tRNA (guanine-N7-)-methyltransferase